MHTNVTSIRSSSTLQDCQGSDNEILIVIELCISVCEFMEIRINVGRQ
jgi:hypothetical protein